jgi:hypothetical protein
MQILEEILQFSCSHFHRLNILSSRILVMLHCTIAYILYSSQGHHVYQNYSSSYCEPFLEIILPAFGFWFLPLDDWRTSENFYTETSLYR